MKHYSSKKVLGFYWHEVQRYPRLLLGLAVMLPITTLLNSILPPLILANVLSRLSKGEFVPHNVWASFGWLIIGYALLELAGGLIAWRVVDYFVFQLEGKVQRNLAQKVFDAMLQQTADFHANNFAGSLVSQNTKLLSAYVRIADNTFFQVSQLVFGLIFAVLILAPRAPYYAVALIIVSLTYLGLAFVVSRPVQKAGAKLAASESKETGRLADAITNVMAIKSFARGTYERQRFAKVTDDTYDLLLWFMRQQRRQLNTFSVATSFMSVLSLVFAAMSVVMFNANIATVFLIFNYTANIIGQLFQFSNNSLRAYNRAVGDAGEMVEILSLEPAVKDAAQPSRLRVKRGQIAFEGVDFRHQDAPNDLFHDFNMLAKPGEKIGLVGHSGSGKTTFTRLLLRFSDIDAGQITIDGQNIADVTQDDLHAAIAYVPQEPLLFHRSITENIAYGKPDSSQVEISQAAEQAHAHEFIKDLPKAYDTLVGERGVKLSGGQRQRIAIARAMLKNAPIFVLDEATSALDSESEVLIQDALWKLMEGRTTIVIAHRLSTIQKMDRILVLDNGKIVEEGSHKQLLAKAGTYAKLWAHQSGGFIEE